MVAPDVPFVACLSSLHCFGGPIHAISLNRLYLSHLRSDALEIALDLEAWLTSILRQRILA